MHGYHKPKCPYGQLPWHKNRCEKIILCAADKCTTKEHTVYYRSAIDKSTSSWGTTDSEVIVAAMVQRTSSLSPVLSILALLL